MNEALLKKLRYRSGPAAVWNAPEGLDLGIESVPEGNAGKVEFAFLFAKNAEDVRAWLPKVTELLAEDAVFWIGFPKQSGKVKSDINRDSLFKLVEGLSEYRPVSNVAIDDTWSALRFRHRDKVKK